MKPLAVHHVSVNVTNAAEGVAFYTDVLGGTVREDRPDFGFGGAWINLGSTQLHLIEAGVPANLGQHFAILVDDLDGVVDELRAKGVQVDDPVVATRSSCTRSASRPRDAAGAWRQAGALRSLNSAPAGSVRTARRP